MKQGITITREYDHHDRPVVRITKRRGKLTLEEVSDLLRTEGWGEWNGYYAIVLNCSEGTLGGNGLYGYEEPKGDALDLYPLENFGDCPVCGQMTPPFQYCPNCGASWKEMDDTVEKRLTAMREETERNMREDLTIRLEEFKKRCSVDAAVQGRVARPPVEFIGEEVLDLAVSALLQGENILLSGGKATGKNILADNLAWLFGRPVYNVSFHVNTDSSTLIGTDTFVDGEVRLRNGPVAQAAQYGGFCILDEINMAKNDAVAVLHAVLDYRRLIDVPGYDCIPMHPATRFIATMNYGYAGTRELNEALVSRFTVIRMPTLQAQQLHRLLRADVPNAAEENLERCIGLFLDLNEKAVNGEISTHPVDLRGMISALRLMTDGMNPKDAVAISITNKCFDEYEFQLVQDVVMTRFV